MSTERVPFNLDELEPDPDCAYLVLNRDEIHLAVTALNFSIDQLAHPVCRDTTSAIAYRRQLRDLRKLLLEACP